MRWKHKRDAESQQEWDGRKCFRTVVYCKLDLNWVELEKITVENKKKF